MIRKKRTNPEIVIDLTGPEGNAYYLLSSFQSYMKQLEFEQYEIDLIISRMKSGTYEELVETFDHYLGDFIILEN